jgi:hypothetical protein
VKAAPIATAEPTVIAVIFAGREDIHALKLDCLASSTM